MITESRIQKLEKALNRKQGMSILSLTDEDKALLMLADDETAKMKLELIQRHLLLLQSAYSDNLNEEPENEEPNPDLNFWHIMTDIIGKDRAKEIQKRIQQGELPLQEKADEWLLRKSQAKSQAPMSLEESLQKIQEHLDLILSEH